MDCCIKCFDDKELKYLVATNSKGIGNCKFCGSENEPVTSVSNLQLKFEFLMEFMEEVDTGRNADVVIDDFFNVFSREVSDNKLNLLQRILDQSLDSKKFKSKWDKRQSEQNWSDLRSEIIGNNRYFPQSELYSRIIHNKGSNDFQLFLQILDRLECTVPPTKILHRARVSDSPLTKDNMGSPPKERTTSGRANPAGISYLYLASCVTTAISEVRPYNDGVVYVSGVSCDKNLIFIDLTNPRRDVSPFGFTSEDYESLIYCLSLLEQFSLDLSKPVKPHKSELEYIPTQFICEYIKSLGAYSGIMFNSSFGAGVNYVAFNANDFGIADPIAYRVTRTSFEHEAI